MSDGTAAAKHARNVATEQRLRAGKLAKAARGESTVHNARPSSQDGLVLNPTTVGHAIESQTLRRNLVVGKKIKIFIAGALEAFIVSEVKRAIKNSHGDVLTEDDL